MKESKERGGILSIFRKLSLLGMGVIGEIKKRVKILGKILEGGYQNIKEERVE